MQRLASTLWEALVGGVRWAETGIMQFWAAFLRKPLAGRTLQTAGVGSRRTVSAQVPFREPNLGETREGFFNYLPGCPKRRSHDRCPQPARMPFRLPPREQGP